MERLLIFDIDDTLVSSKYDVECFVQAFDDTQGLKGFPVGMRYYVHTTDIGIAGEIIASAHGRAATASELQTIQERHCFLLEERARRDPTSIQQIPGAGQLLRYLRKDPSNHIVLATGAWAATAALKLRLAELDVLGLPCVSSNDAPVRLELLRLAIERAKQAYARDGFDPVVLVGDGPWDLEVARELDIGFIGIGKYLRGSSATWVFDDLQDTRGLAMAFASFSTRSQQRMQ